MDSIRKRENRPTIALVLSGGGAKGAAHIGVKKLIDEMQIPVDMICGTSMGGLMGGMMALGYDCNFLDSLLRCQDWSYTLTDRVAPKYIPYSTKKYKSTFAINIPFHMEDEDFAKKITEQEKHLRGGREGTNSFLSSLPAGYVNGFNVNNFLSSFSVGYQDSLSFQELPIPFFCVASDVVSCKAKNWSSGSVTEAMRSTMSIPGLFNPVRTDAMVLVDGGTRNNFPVDLARAMGADIVIGVDLSDLRPTYSEINNALDLGMQFITMLGTDSFQKNRDNCNIFIKPNLDGYNMLSFSTEAIDTIIGRGYCAAQEKKAELQALKDSLCPNSKPYLNHRTATDIGRQSVKLSKIEFIGISDNESRYLHKKIKIKVGQAVNAGIINDAMSRIQATGAFASVTYSLLGSEEPYVLRINCVKGPTHQFGLSFRGDTEEYPSIALNLGLNTRKLIGSKFDISGKLGRSSGGQVHYMLDLPNLPTINVSADIANINPDLVEKDMNVKGNVNLLTHNGKIFFSNLGWTRLDMQLGFQSRMTNLFGNTPYARIMENFFDSHSCFLGAFLYLTTYTLDNVYYPSKGHHLHLGVEHDFKKISDDTFRPTNVFLGDFRFVIPVCSFFSIIPDIHFRGTYYDKNSEKQDAYTFIHSNTYGGAMSGRYTPNQVSFVGFNNIKLSDKANLGLMNLDLRFNPFKNLYASVKGGIAQEFDYLEDLKDTNIANRVFGAGVEVGYNSILGPLKLNVHWSDFNYKWQFYLSFGYDF